MISGNEIRMTHIYIDVSLAAVATYRDAVLPHDIFEISPF